MQVSLSPWQAGSILGSEPHRTHLALQHDCAQVALLAVTQHHIDGVVVVRP